MKRIGITGGIGSGKSTLARIFSEIGVPVYYADIEAKKISSSPIVIDQLKTRFGAEIIRDHHIDNTRLAQLVFNDPQSLSFLNQILHPLIFSDFLNWAERQSPSHPYVMAEAAILFESKMDILFDFIINVEAPVELQIKRVIQRNNISKEEVVARMKNQLSAASRREKADITLLNDEKHPLLPQVLSLHQKFSI